jgi:hypothetical protein
MDFKTLDDNFGEDPVGASLDGIDPLVARYGAGLDRLGEQEFFQTPLETLFQKYPFDAPTAAGTPGGPPSKP